jgi:hypothetical protein
MPHSTPYPGALGTVAPSSKSPVPRSGPPPPPPPAPRAPTHAPRPPLEKDPWSYNAARGTLLRESSAVINK